MEVEVKVGESSFHEELMFLISIGKNHMSCMQHCFIYL